MMAGDGISAIAADFLDHILGGRTVITEPLDTSAEVVHDDLGPLGGEQQSVFAPDPAARTRHYDDAPFETAHPMFPLPCIRFGFISTLISMILATPSGDQSIDVAGAVPLHDIEFSVDENHVATITLNRPDAMNSISKQMAAELAWAWQRVRDTDDIHAVVLRAAGDRAFCTGVDIKGDSSWFYRNNVWNTFDPGTVVSPKLQHRCWKPVVTAVNGFAAGGAQYLLNESDIIICSDDAAFFDPHANASIVSALEPIGMLHRGVPLGDVLRWALMGTEERITAPTALRIGLVSEVVERDQLWDRAHAIAVSIAARNPTAIQGTIRAIWESLDMTRSTALQNGMAYTHIGNPPLAERRATPRHNAAPEYR